MIRKFSCESDLACAYSVSSSGVLCFCVLDINFPDKTWDLGRQGNIRNKKRHKDSVEVRSSIDCSTNIHILPIAFKIRNVSRSVK